MKYFIFRACWSQTDQDIYIVEAANKKAAENKLTISPLNPHHWDYIGVSDNLII